MSALLVTALAFSPLAPAADQPSSGKVVSSGTRFTNAPLTRVAKTWERILGGSVTVSDRAQARKVTLEISASAKDELRQQFIAALRENGIYVIARADGVLFDTEPAPSATK